MNKKTILSALLLVVLAVTVAAPAFAILGPTNLNSNFNTAATFMNTVKNIANFVIAFITILGIIFIVWGAIQYVTAGGDEGAVEKAKSTITYALIGLFIAAMAYVLEGLVLSGIVG
jgi:hypothetical protein